MLPKVEVLSFDYIFCKPQIKLLLDTYLMNEHTTRDIATQGWVHQRIESFAA